MSDCIIEFDNVKFEYQKQKSKKTKADTKATTEKRPNFSLEIDKLKVEKGEIYLIVGANGTGKSTLSKLMCGVLKADSGQILIDGEDIDRFSIGEIGRKISYLFQEPKKQLFTTNVYSEMTFIGEMLGLNSEIVNMRADKLLERFNLSELKNRSIYRLSRGESQRLAIASLLMNDLDFLILDEPTTGLDKENREILFETIAELCQNGMGIAIVSHDEELLEKFGQNVIKLINGKLENSNVEDVDPKITATKLATQPEITATKLATQPPIKHIEDVEDVKKVEGVDPRTKLLAIFLMTTLAVIFQDLAYMAILAAVSLVISMILGGNLFSILRKLKNFVSLLIAVSIAQIIFRRTGQPLWTVGDFVVIYLDGVTFGLMAALRFFIILCSASVMIGENSKKVMTALSKMKIPYTFVFMLMIALRFLPSFRDSFKDSLTAIQLRGIDIKKTVWNKKIKLYSSLILPVVATAIVNSQDLAMSAEARGFGAMRKRTELVDVKLRVVDYFAMLLLVALFGILAVLYYI